MHHRDPSLPHTHGEPLLRALPPAPRPTPVGHVGRAAEPAETAEAAPVADSPGDIEYASWLALLRLRAG